MALRPLKPLKPLRQPLNVIKGLDNEEIIFSNTNSN